MTGSAQTLKKGWRFGIRHALILAIFLPVFLIALYLLTTHSDAYETAEHFVRTNPHLAKQLGPVSNVSFRFWSGFNVAQAGSGGEASFVLGVSGGKDEAIVDIRMKRAADSWRVDQAYMTTKKEKAIPVPLDP